MRKVIILNNLELTKSKQAILNDLKEQYLNTLSTTCMRLHEAVTSTQLHHLTYSAIRKTSTLPSDFVQEARKDIWKLHTVLEKHHFTGKFKFNKCTIRLNKKWFRYITTKRDTPCFKITYSSKKTIVIPVAKDRQFQRLNSYIEDEWTFDNISLLESGKIAVVIEKEFKIPETTHRFVVGVDIGSSTLAAVSVYDIQTGKVIRQLYLGRDVAHRQRRYTQRRAKLKSLADKGSRQAVKSFKRLSRKQRDFVKTRSGQISKQIINIALEYNSYVAIEKLRKLRVKKGKMNKNGRSKTNRIPYRQLIDFLKSAGEISYVPVVEIDPYHTSKWCPRCGAINDGHSSKNYSLYVCTGCGLIVNSDRKASLSVGVKSVLERKKSHELTVCGSIQISGTQVPVSGLMRPHDVGLNQAIA